MKVRFILFVLVSLLLVSCHTAKEMIVKKKNVPLISENKLLRNIESNELTYNTLFAKRVDIVLKNDKGSRSFKASLKIQRDSFIQVSVTAPLGIEIARVLLTRDSIKFVDVYHKEYFFTDYEYFYEHYETMMDYDYVQKILTNKFVHFNLNDAPGTPGRYKLDRSEEGYKLSTLEEKALNRKIKRLYKKRKKEKDYMLVRQEMLIDPFTYRPLSFMLEDVEEEMGVKVKYDLFKNFSNKFFPEKIIFDLFSPEGMTSLELKFQRLEFDIPVESNFRISSKYKRIDHR